MRRTNPKFVKYISETEHEMDEIPKDILKSIFDKVNTDDTFSQRIGVKLIELLPGFARTTLPSRVARRNFTPTPSRNRK
jgi:hypothetical protein